MLKKRYGENKVFMNISQHVPLDNQTVGVHMDPDDALRVAHDLRRWAMISNVKRRSDYMFKEDDLLLRDTPVEEGVGDFVVRVTEVRHNVEYGAVVYNGIIVVSDSPTFPVSDEFWLGAANNYTLYKGEEALPPVVDTKFIFGDNEHLVEASNSYVEDEEVFLGLFPI